VVSKAADGGRWIVEWEDGDTADTLKECRHLKKRSDSAELSGDGKGGKREEEHMETNIAETDPGFFDPLLPPAISDLAACSRKRGADATFQPQPFARASSLYAARQARCVVRSAFRARESALENGDAVCSDTDPDDEKDKEEDSACVSPADEGGGTSGMMLHVMRAATFALPHLLYNTRFLFATWGGTQGVRLLSLQEPVFHVLK
jgi:hypothetical protein